MIGEQVDGGRHQLVEHVAARSAWEVVEHRLVGQVVRWGGPHIHRERGRPLGSSPDQQVAIAHAGDEFEAVAAEFRLRGREQLGRFFGRNMIGREVLHRLILDGHEIATNGPILFTQLNALGSRLDWRAAGEVGERVVAEEAHIADFGAGGQGSSACGKR